MTTLKQVFCRPTEDELSRFKSISDLESLSDKDAAWEECIIDATHFNCHRFFTHGGTFTSCDIDDVNRLGLIEVTTEQFFDLLDDRITVWRLIERGYDKHPSKEIYAKKTEAGASIVVDDRWEQKRLEDEFNNISEPWGFIATKDSKESKWLKSLHKTIVKKLNKELNYENTH